VNFLTSTMENIVSYPLEFSLTLRDVLNKRIRSIYPRLSGGLGTLLLK